MKIFKSKQSSWIDRAGYSKKILATPEQLAIPGILVQQIRIAPGQVAKNHYHKKQTEIFYFLNTVGTFSINNKPIDLEVGDVLVVEPNDLHEVSNEGVEDFLYIAFKHNWEENDYFETES
jgi:quercetin dioxygenase-like cupin family protein